MFCRLLTFHKDDIVGVNVQKSLKSKYFILYLPWLPAKSFIFIYDWFNDALSSLHSEMSPLDPTWHKIT